MHDSLQQLSAHTSNSDAFNVQQRNATNTGQRTPQSAQHPNVQHAMDLGYANAFEAICNGLIKVK